MCRREAGLGGWEGLGEGVECGIFVGRVGWERVEIVWDNMKEKEGERGVGGTSWFRTDEDADKVYCF